MHEVLLVHLYVLVYLLIVLQVCNQTKRTRLVYSSTSETVEIRILPGGHGKDSRPKQFLLHYESKHAQILVIV